MDGLRLDKWLWFARFCKTRSLAAAAIAAGRVRLNGRVVVKTAQPVRAGDTVMLPAGPRWRLVRVLALGERRGPAPEAQTLYQELSPPPLDEDGLPL